MIRGVYINSGYGKARGDPFSNGYIGDGFLLSIFHQRRLDSAAATSLLLHICIAWGWSVRFLLLWLVQQQLGGGAFACM